MSSISHKMAEFTKTITYDQIPENALKEAKRFILDSIGVGLLAVGNEDMEKAHNYVKKLGGPDQATIIGYGTTLNVANATLMNSLLIRALDYNDIYWEQDPSHPSDIIPAALSVGEWKGKSGKDILSAIVAAYELEMRLCNAAFPGIREIGWHHASLTQLVSPLVAGKMMDLSLEEMVAATGISGSSHFTLGGVVAGALTNMKNTADPMAVEAGVRGALLAAEGYEGPVEVYEGKEGVFDVINDVEWKEGKLLEDLGEKFMITQCGYKAFPTEALTHQPITAALEVMEENEIDSGEVEEVVVETTTRGKDILSDDSKYKPETKETADHSLPYCIAVAVTRGNVLPSHFEKETLFAEDIRGMLPRIKVVANKEIDDLFPGTKRAIVTVKTTRGEFSRKVDYAKGRKESPLSDEELQEKFKANAKKVLKDDEIDRLIDATMNFEEIKDVRKYIGKTVSLG